MSTENNNLKENENKIENEKEKSVKNNEGKTYSNKEKEFLEMSVVFGIYILDVFLPFFMGRCYYQFYSRKISWIK